ncbi:putative Protein prune-like protein [Hypsibius exemplaris]|uniref:DHHA2 domain-containing protein n=1 Tax=Hypsibius exemplaris TaxID=2072580 RepID=A0A1W0XDC9_HYPEX|nr:putative Protein prune-like protein [Hypsibius exemplaris]
MEKDRKEFVDYLRAVKASVVKNELQKYSTIHIVVGNEACDLDSAVSALTYAFHLTHSSVRSVSRNDGAALIIPLLNIPEDDYSLKTEVVHALQREGVEQADLIFADHLDVAGLSRGQQQPGGAKPPRLTLTLVDHHVPVGSFTGLEGDIQEIIDHHVVVACRDTDFIKKVKQTIEPVGSCATLIAEKVLASSAHGPTNAVLVSLLRQTIIVDTVNFSASAKKTTAKDESVTAALEMADCGGGRVAGQSREEIFVDLTQAKSDISKLSTAQLLKKDLKVLRVAGVQVAVSSIPVLVKEYFCQQQRQQELADRCRAQSVDAAVVLGVSLQGAVSRDILIYSGNAICLEKICEGLQSSAKPDLDLKESADAAFTPLSNQYRYFHQGTASASRKQILPVLADVLHASSTAICRGGAASAVTRKPSSDIPETATPPNSFIAGHGFLTDAHSVFTNVHRKILQLDTGSSHRTGANKNNSALSCQMSNEYSGTATPSNTFADDGPRNLMHNGTSCGGNRMRDVERDELEDRMELLKLRQDDNENNDSESPCDVSRASLSDVDDHNDAMFDMDEDEGVGSRIVSGRVPIKK